jgi:hypothetical protein
MANLTLSNFIGLVREVIDHENCIIAITSGSNDIPTSSDPTFKFLSKTSSLKLGDLVFIRQASIDTNTGLVYTSFLVSVLGNIAPEEIKPAPFTKEEVAFAEKERAKESVEKYDVVNAKVYVNYIAQKYYYIEFKNEQITDVTVPPWQISPAVTF